MTETIPVDPRDADEAQAAPAPPPPIIEFRKVTKYFEDGRGARIDVLKDFDFTIESGQAGSFVVLLGQSGCGKSTVLNLISGLLLPDGGDLFVAGNPVTGPTPGSATVPQAYTCFPWLTALGNVEFGLHLSGRPRDRSERRDIAMHYLRRVGLVDRRDAYPKQLSGGQQQRVAIARTLAMNLPIVLMDEPFGALDAQTRAEMQQMVIQLWKEERNTILFVTHDITEALLIGKRIVVFSSRPVREYFNLTDLDDKLGPDRTPEITRTDEFLNLYEVLRQQLRNNQPEAETPHRP